MRRVRPVERTGPIPGLALSALLAACSADVPAAMAVAEFRDSLGITTVVNPPTGAWAPDGRWRVEPDLVFGDPSGDPDLEFGDIAGLVVTATGEIVVLDRLAGEVRVLGPDGAFLRRIGRQGRGPGELSLAAAALVSSGDTLYIPDAVNGRITRFMVTGEVLPDLPYPQNPGTAAIGWAAPGPGRLVYRGWEPLGNTSALLTTGPAVPGEQDTLLILAYPRRDLGPQPSPQELMAGTARIRVDPLAPLPIWAVLEDGGIATGHSAAYRIEIHGGDGRLQRIIHGPVERVPATETDHEIILLKVEEQIRERAEAVGVSTDMVGGMRELVMPDSLPAYTALAAGSDGSLLAQRAAGIRDMDARGFGGISYESLGGRQWDVFDREGRYLGSMDLPEKIRLVTVRDDFLYGVVSGETDEHRVVRLRIVKPSGPG